MTSDLTRRQFISGSAALLGSLTAGCGGGAPLVAPEGPARRGGRLRLGIIDGGQAGNLDVHKPLGLSSTIRGFALYSKLWEWSDDMLPQLALAEFAEAAPDASSWTIRLRQGLEFHHGKTIGADDVIFSIRRLLDPQLASSQGHIVNAVDPRRVVKLDDRTVRIGFKDGIGFVPLPETWVNFGGIVPTDYHPVSNVVGAGPYRLKDFHPGRRSLFTRFENYFREGRPYPDELEIVDFKDQVSRFEALLAGQIDMANALAPEQGQLFQRERRARLIVSKSNAWRGFNLNLAQPPFDDIRVRQAFRLLVDRQELIDRVLQGQGRPANDLYAPQDPTFDQTIPQRPHDPAAAKRLLQQAGVSKLELVTDAAGASAALVLAQQAARIGVQISIKQVDASIFNGPKRNSWPLSTAGTIGHPFLAAQMGADGPLSQANRTNFRDPRFAALIEQAMRTPDVERRKPLVHEAQRIQYERGGLLIWGFADSLDGVSPKVGGIRPERSHFPTWRFDRLWLNA